jgi:hypothetical protein
MLAPRDSLPGLLSSKKNARELPRGRLMSVAQHDSVLAEAARGAGAEDAETEE